MTQAKRKCLKETIAWKNKLALLAMLTVVTLSKSTYFPVFLLVFLLQKGIFRNKRERTIYISALYVTFTPYMSGSIDGSQGRYLLPLLLPVLYFLPGKSLVPNIKNHSFNIGAIIIVFYCYFDLLSSIIVTHYS